MSLETGACIFSSFCPFLSSVSESKHFLDGSANSHLGSLETGRAPLWANPALQLPATAPAVSVCWTVNIASRGLTRRKRPKMIWSQHFCFPCYGNVRSNTSDALWVQLKAAGYPTRWFEAINHLFQTAKKNPSCIDFSPNKTGAYLIWEMLKTGRKVHRSSHFLRDLCRDIISCASSCFPSTGRWQGNSDNRCLETKSESWHAAAAKGLLLPPHQILRVTEAQ